MGFTLEAAEKLQAHYGDDDLDDAAGQPPPRARQRHRLLRRSAATTACATSSAWSGTAASTRTSASCEGCVLPEPTLRGYTFPDPLDPRFFADIPGQDRAATATASASSQIGFSLYERAWTLRGMENLMMDFLDHPDFVHELLNAIADYNIAQVARGAEVRHRRRLLRRRLGPAARPADGAAICGGEFIYPVAEADVRRGARRRASSS